MSDILHRVELHNAEQGREVLTKSALPWVGEQLRQGRALVAEFRLLDDERSVRQNRFYWGVVLKDISEQANLNGQRYSADAWHELFKRQFLQRRVRKVAVAGRLRKVVSVSLGSTTDLSVRGMNLYLEKVQAFAATDLGVAFSDMHVPEPTRRQGAAQPAVDLATGEILNHNSQEVPA